MGWGWWAACIAMIHAGEVVEREMREGVCKCQEEARYSSLPFATKGTCDAAVHFGAAMAVAVAGTRKSLNS